MSVLSVLSGRMAGGDFWTPVLGEHIHYYGY